MPSTRLNLPLCEMHDIATKTGTTVSALEGYVCRARLRLCRGRITSRSVPGQCSEGKQTSSTLYNYIVVKDINIWIIHTTHKCERDCRFPTSTVFALSRMRPWGFYGLYFLTPFANYERRLAFPRRLGALAR